MGCNMSGYILTDGQDVWTEYGLIDQPTCQYKLMHGWTDGILLDKDTAESVLRELDDDDFQIVLVNLKKEA